MWGTFGYWVRSCNSLTLRLCEPCPLHPEEELDHAGLVVLNLHHSFFGTLAGGDSSVVCQPLYRDLLIEFIAAGNLGVNCIWKENHKEKAL